MDTRHLLGYALVALIMLTAAAFLVGARCRRRRQRREGNRTIDVRLK